MKKQTLKTIIGFILFNLIAYLLVSFAMWDINAAHWSKEVRTLWAVMSPATGVLVVAFQNLGS
jgi:hypothetical protein